MMRGGPGAGGGGKSDWLSTMQPLSIVLIVVIVGAAFYMWRQRMLQSRAALITLAAILGVLVYYGFFAKPNYEKYMP